MIVKIFFFFTFMKVRKWVPYYQRYSLVLKCPSNKLPSIRRLGSIQELAHQSVDRRPRGTAAGTFQLAFRRFHLFVGD